MDLERLIATEQRNESLVAAARAQADAILAAAMNAVGAREAEFQWSTAEAIREAEAALAAERDRRIAEIEEGTRRAVARYDGFDGDRLARAIPPLIGRLVAGEER